MTNTEFSAISPRAQFDRFPAAVDNAVCVVTARAGEETDGCLVGFHTQCSLDPPRYLILLARSNHTTDLALQSDYLAVHLLAPHDVERAEWFGGLSAHRTPKFVPDAAPRRSSTETGELPLLDGVTAWFIGRIEERVDVLGDHIGFMLEPLEAGGHPAFGALRLHDVIHIHPGQPSASTSRTSSSAHAAEGEESNRSTP